MSSYRINLLKLIDLAIGCPHPGSVNFNLLHRILYILALRDTATGGLGLPTTETDEIELSHSHTLVNQKLLDEALKDGSKTRLTVQRVMNRPENDNDNDHACNTPGVATTRIRIAGSRIVVPYGGNSHHSMDQPERIESQMSNMSTMFSDKVSELEERVQQISLKPSNACEKGLNELRRRIEGLEKFIEEPVLKKQSMDDEPPPAGASELKLEMEKLWDSVRMLTEKIDSLPRKDGNHISNSPGQTGVLSGDEATLHASEERVNTDNASSYYDKQEADAVVPPTDSHMAAKINSIESNLHELELKHQSLVEEINSTNRTFDSTADANVVTQELPQLAARMALIEQTFGTRFDQIEHSIKRLFQEKADDVAIESRIRQSMRFSSDAINRASFIPLDELPHRRRDDRNDSLAAVKDQLKATQEEVLLIRETIQSMTNQDNLLATINTNAEKIKQLHVQFETFKIADPVEPETAAGTKLKPITDLRCISCNRAVAMDRCDELIPKPPLLSVSRVVKPNLRRQLQEVHRSKDQHGTAGVNVQSMAHFEKIYHSIAEAKAKHGK
nr:uncharacterized protein LOC115269361 [Aedes albopictus]